MVTLLGGGVTVRGVMDATAVRASFDMDSVTRHSGVISHGHFAWRGRNNAERDPRFGGCHLTERFRVVMRLAGG